MSFRLSKVICCNRLEMVWLDILKISSSNQQRGLQRFVELESEVKVFPAKLHSKNAFVIVLPYCQLVELKIYSLKIHFSFIVFNEVQF